MGVPYADILNNNESLKDAGSGLTAAFLGGTAGIGRATLIALAKHTTSPTIYIVGRSEPNLNTLIKDTLQPLNTSATFVPIVVGDLTLVANAVHAADQIKSHPTNSASKIDFLYTSPGFVSFKGPNITSEGYESTQSIRHYSRAAFILGLLPLIKKSPNPRVVTVLAGGKEGAVNTSDWELTGPNAFGVLASAGQTTSMHTLFLEELAKQPGCEKLSLIHIYPGIVKGTSLRFEDPPFPLNLITNYILPFFANWFGYTSEEAGERALFAGTSGRFRRINDETERDRAVGSGSLVQKGSNGKVGSGVYTVQEDSSVIGGSKVLDGLRSDGTAEKSWRRTVEVFEKNGGK